MPTAEDADYYAFCDQDDIWDKDKLSAAIEVMSGEDDGIPLLYTCRVTSIDNDYNVISDNHYKSYRTNNKYEAFQKCDFPGCVYVFNSTARNLIRRYNGFIESHDWAVYAIISVFGKVILDTGSHMKYRIHEDNVMAKASTLGLLKQKVSRFTKKSEKVRSRFAKGFLQEYGDEIADEEVKRNIQILADYDRSISARFRLAFNKNFKGIIFRLYALMSRV